MTPVVAIVGRPNVGKSTLFNALTQTRDALVADWPGLTRDRQYGQLELADYQATLIDTGGMLGDEGELTELMDQQIMQAIDEAHLVMFVVSARDGLVGDDERILERIRSTEKPVLLLANKAEGQINEVALAEFYQLGVADVLAVSSAHRKGLQELLAFINEHCKTHQAQFTADVIQDHGPKIAIIGRPNVGKSTLVNRLLRQDRVLAYDMPGTTRDSIALPLIWDDMPYTLIDTAGVRRRAKVGEGIEKFSILKTIESIKLAQICVVMMDATEGITDQDLHLLGLAVHHAKPVILVINKWDHLSQEHRDYVKEKIHLKMQAFEWVPLLFISALHGSGLRVLMERIDLLMDQADQELTANQLTNVLSEAFKAHQPPLVQGLSSQLKFAHSGGNHPMRIVIHGKRTSHLPDSYKRYLENTFRKAFDLKGVPIVMQFRDGKNPYKDKKNKDNAYPSRRKKAHNLPKPKHNS
ncbi:ribosome biogenesis GTPase Der [Marinicella meishanensis]|uniref:ribosome biogenesis GTPase Der n=1 Tax=Marinicella meishanensis TaxID=2873263 RepID=UPI001CBD9D2B|nr:ribosome biogenesis GTPase Der [Marinicella sp. NBU2979]